MEWKQDRGEVRKFSEAPLKPSLVEWKLRFPCEDRAYRISLETFLSGMETTNDTASPSARHSLKPSLVEWKLRLCIFSLPCFNALKPSLVEWKHQANFLNGAGIVTLETFLSGMETRAPLLVRALVDTLKPSLVEWKQPPVRVVLLHESTLKPSLVEWKPFRRSSPASAR